MESVSRPARCWPILAVSMITAVTIRYLAALWCRGLAAVGPHARHYYACALGLIVASAWAGVTA